MNDHDEDYDRFQALKGDIFMNYLGEVEEDERFYARDYKGDFLPEGWSESELMEPIIPPTARKAVDTMADHIMSTPKIMVPVRPTNRDKLSEQDFAERKRAFLSSFWHQVAFRQGDPLGHGKKKTIKDGRIVVKKTIKWDEIPDMPEKSSKTARQAWRRAMARVMRHTLIWKVKVCPTETIFEDPDNPYDPEYVYESYMIRIGEAKREFPDAKGDWRDAREFDRIEYVEMYTRPHAKDPGRFKVWIAGELVHDEENPYHWEEDGIFYGHVPYQIWDNGWGDVTSENRPEDRYVGLLRHMRELLIAEARQLTAAEAQSRISIFPMIVTTNMPELQNGQSSIRIGPAEINNITVEAGNEQSIDIKPWAQTDPGIMNLLQKIQNEADGLAGFNTLGGVPQRGVDSATEADMNVRNKAAKLSGPVFAMQAVVIGINRQVLQEIEHILEVPVTLYGASEGDEAEVTLMPSEIKGYYETYVEMGTTDQAALDLRTLRTWTDLMRVSPAISYQTSMERSGIINPQQEMERRTAENLYMSPEANQVRVLTMLSSMGAYGQMVAQNMMMGGKPAEGGPSSRGDANALMTMGSAGAEGPTEPTVSEARQNVQTDQAEKAMS